ncbi:hypothetical protein THIOKS1860012 [Thiocapsa sp. KS1]|nr:hypothetical protein THIOKS1860012 [Thiocapsa sp. KS1]
MVDGKVLLFGPCRQDLYQHLGVGFGYARFPWGLGIAVLLASLEGYERRFRSVAAPHPLPRRRGYKGDR